MSMYGFRCSYEEILERQLLATFSTIEKALVGRKESFLGPYVLALTTFYCNLGHTSLSENQWCG